MNRRKNKPVERARPGRGQSELPAGVSATALPGPGVGGPAGLAWRMLVILQTRMHARLEQAASDAGVVPITWFDVLATLDGSPARRLRLRDLADAVLLTRAGLTRVLDRTEAKGLISRQACPSDGRGSEAVLTAAGQTALRRARAVYGPLVTDHFAAYVSPAAAAALIDTVRNVLVANDWLPDARPVTVTIKGRPASSEAPAD